MRKQTCLWCAKLFKAHSSVMYCSYVCKMASWDTKETATPCYYCGLPADTIDHVPPVSVRPTLIKLGIASRYPHVEVPACHECNSLIGAKHLWKLSERKKFIKEKIKRRYAKFLRIPYWSPTEIAAMDPHSMMRGYIEQGVIMRDIVRQRIA